MKISQTSSDIALFLAGGLYPLGFAPFGIWPLPIICLALLFGQCVHASPARAALRGFLFGCGLFSSGVYWIYVSVHDFAGATPLAGFLITVSCVLFLATFPAAACFLARVYPCHPARVRLLAVFPIFWIGLEWFRSWLEFPGFPWLQIGYSQSDSVISGYAALLGTYGAGLVAAVIAGLFAFAAGGARRTRFRTLAAVLAILVPAVVSAAINWTRPAGRPFRVTLLQGNISQDVKWLPEMKKDTLRRYVDMTRANWDSRLIIWPETAVPVSYQRIRGLLDELGDEAREHGTDLLIGIPYQDPETGGTLNAAVEVGTRSGVYFKRHLVPFGEYLPFQPLSGSVTQWMDFQMSNFSSGPQTQSLIVAAGLPVAMMICYEDVFGHEVRTALPWARYLVNVTNDAWFGHSIALEQNLQMARMRAMESGRYLARAANTGLTAIISADGTIVRQAEPLTQAAISGEIIPMKGWTPYMYYGDYGIFALMGLLLLLVVVYRSRATGGIPKGFYGGTDRQGFKNSMKRSNITW